MCLQQVRKSSILLLFIFFVFLLFSGKAGVSAETGWRLWLDGEDKGVIPAYESNGAKMVSIGTIARALDLSLFPKDGTLIIKNGTERVQIMQETSAVWFNVKLVPMASEAVFQNNRWWIDSRSALKIMSMLINARGADHILQWAGSGEIPEKKVRKSASRNINKRSFTPKTEGEDLSRLNSIRWGDHGSLIRVVMDIPGERIPALDTGNGKIAVRFAYSPRFQMSDLDSPYPSVVNTAITHSGKNMIIYFKHNSASVNHFVLEDPQRLVIDFSRSSSGRLPSLNKAPDRIQLPSTVEPDGNIMDANNSGSGIVVIDPGHGGKDPGAVANGIREKDINLKISKELASQLRAKGISVRLTRTDDRYLRLRERTELATKWNAEVFVSIHANALPPGRHATGMEIYLMALPTDKDAMQLALIENRELSNGNSESHNVQASDKRTRMLLNILGNMQQNAKIGQSTDMAEVLFNCGKRQGLPMRRVAQAPFFVLRGAGMPSVLIETGFITESQEARKLASSSYQKKIAAALARGIEDYLERS